MLMYTFGIVLAVSLLYIVVTTIRQTPATPLTPEEAADLSIGQYRDRQNANTMPEKATRSIPILSNLLPGQEDSPSGCSIRFSLIPDRKSVEPRGTITYGLTLLNQGSETCRNVSLSVYYTDKEHFISSVPSPTASDYYWAIDNIDPNKSKRIEISTEALVGEGEQIMSEACVAADNSQDICSNNVVFVNRGGSVTSSATNSILVQKVTGAIWGQIFGKKEFGIWVWDSPMKMTSTQASKVIEISKKNGFNVIYLTVDDYLPIVSIRNSAERNRQKDVYMKTLSSFITAAHKAGIEVDVVVGDKDWAEPSNRWKGYAFIDFVREYNLTHPGSLIRGLQYDVEPYLLSSYEVDKRKELKAYVEFIEQSAIRMQTVPVQFSIVIPHFYDDIQNWTPDFTYNGVNAHTYKHLLKALEKKPKSTIIIMAYRNFFEENNGTKQISEVEVNEATKGKYSTRVIIAQETGDVNPGYVTFHDYPKVALFDSLNEISTYFGRYSNFGGVAVHYFDSFLKMD